MNVATLARDEALQAFADLARGGLLQIRSGVQPGHVTDDVTGELLCSLALPTFGEPAAGTMHTGPFDTAFASGSGLASWFRVYTSTGQVLEDGSAAELELDSLALAVGVEVHIDRWTVSLPEG